MTDKKKKAKTPAVQLTPEQLEARKAEAAVKIEAAKLRQEELNKYEAWVEKTTQKQLRGELRRIERAEKGMPGLTIAFAVALRHVLDNTKTIENPFAKLSAYPL